MQGCGKTCGNVSLAPFGLSGNLCCACSSRYSVLQSLLFLFYLVGKFHKTFRSILLSVEHHVLYYLQLVGSDIVVGHLGCRIHDSEVHTLANGMIEKHRVHCLAYIVVATERERQVAHATAHMRSWQICLYPVDCLNKVDSIVVVLFHARSYGKHVGVEYYIERIHAHLLCKKFVGTCCNFNASFVSSGLSYFVKAHNHHGCTIAHHVASVAQEHLLALFQRD